MKEHKTCRQPDHDCPKLICGAPLPCPYHTVILDLEAQTITEPVTSRISPRARQAMKVIAQKITLEFQTKAGRKVRIPALKMRLKRKKKARKR